MLTLNYFPEIIQTTIINIAKTTIGTNVVGVNNPIKLPKVANITQANADTADDANKFPLPVRLFSLKYIDSVNTIKIPPSIKVQNQTKLAFGNVNIPSIPLVFVRFDKSG
jgi:hypothetical protein